MGRRLLRLALGGLACALLVLVLGALLRLTLLGADAGDARMKVESDVHRAFTSMALELRALAERADSPEDVRLAGAGDVPAAIRLFASATDAIGDRDTPQLAVTIYAADHRPLAWAGRPTDLPADRLQREASWFLVPGELGFRLVYVTPSSNDGVRHGAIAAERSLAMANGAFSATGGGTACADRNAFCFPTRLGPVIIELPLDAGATPLQTDTFDVLSPSGEPLLTAAVWPEDLAGTRERWRRAAMSLALGTAALALLLIAGPLLDWRNHARRAGAVLGAAAGIAAVVLAARAVLTAASPADWTDLRLFSSATYASALLPRLLTSPFDFLLTALAMAAFVALALDAVERWRLRDARRRRAIDGRGRLGAYLAMQFAAGTLMAAFLAGHDALVRDTIAQTSLDLVHFSLQPWDISRSVLQIGVIVLNAAVVGAGISCLRAALVRWRVPRGDWRLLLATIVAWLLPLLLWQHWRVPGQGEPLPVIVAGAVIIGVTLFTTRLVARYRHGSQAFRLTLLSLGLILPACAFYPSLFQAASLAKAQLVETRYSDEALQQRQALLTQLLRTQDEIDRIPDLARLASEPPLDGADAEAATDRAFRVWQRTPLALYLITSSVELYGPDGALVSRFAFNLPEDLTTTPRSLEDTCDWERYGEVAPFFADERQMLHAGRKLCRNSSGSASDGSIVVHAMLDYENLPFIASRSPYRELLLGPTDPARPPARSLYGWSGRDVEFAFYGWSGRPLYPSSQPAWQLDAETFEQLVASREPFWRDLRRGDALYHVFLQTDRSGIYALGFASVTPLGHLVNLAELTVLAVGAYLLYLLGNAAFGALSRRATPAPALLRELRASFYRKLFLAFVAAVMLPVAALAVVTRGYVVDEMRSTVEQEAIRTASAARRVVEDLIAQLDIVLDDNLMVWVSRLIGQDANVFEGPRLLATSERNLFASGLLPSRAPADAYRAIQLQNEAATVAVERVGAIDAYLVAATPLTSRQPGAMLTVPLTSRQQEIEDRIATLNRRMLLGALLFILAGAGLGYSMAERISDPVNRLTRATRRISRGDLDARILARSSDELRRLVDDFNSMAAELRRQRIELERTHRLEAWAEMARQVAHEIKNPLTPIQLTAEHLRRVHADQGAPLSPVLQECVSTILSQVHLLRQIASEFSSFASSPTAKPAVAEVPEILDEVLEPYRIGVHDRVRFDLQVPAALPRVFVDRTLVARALTNIMENALHAMPGSGTLTVGASHDERTVHIRVSDTGAGMDPDALARAFEPYFSTKATGTGLGLAIARRNIELNGGTIEITSQRDRGTTVEITLPIDTRVAGSV